jgi:hypothetical protein
MKYSVQFYISSPTQRTPGHGVDFDFILIIVHKRILAAWQTRRHSQSDWPYCWPYQSHLQGQRQSPHTCLCIAQLLVEGGSLLEADGVVLVVVRASNRHGLSLDLGEEPNEFSRVAFNGARMGCDLGRVLVYDDAQLERVSVVRASVVVGSSMRVHWLAMRGMCGAWNGFCMAVTSGTLINRQLTRDTIYSANSALSAVQNFTNLDKFITSSKLSNISIV